MTAALAEPAVLGVQTPRLSWMPVGDWDYALGDQCVAWARDVLGVYLDPWECLVLRMMLARRPDGRWACPKFGLCLPRRNGKSHVLVVRFLFGLLVLGDVAAEYTAHHGKTVRSTFKLAQRLLENAVGTTPDYRSYTSAGREALRFPDTGQEFAFSTRTASAGRGTGGDVLAVDEAQEASDDEMDALTPILGDRSLSGNPQLLYAGSSGDYESVVFGRVRRQALSGDSSQFGWAEWSIDDDAYFAADVFAREQVVHSTESIAQANPSLGIMREDGSGGLALEWLQGQIDTLSPAGFAREHLGVGTWPKGDDSDWLIPRAAWNAQARPDVAVPDGSLVFAVSAARGGGDRPFSIAAAGTLEDTCHGWLERMDRGSAWVVPEVVRLVSASPTAAVIIDDGGPASSLADELEQALKVTGVPLARLAGRDAAQACGSLQDSVTADPPAFTHRGQTEVDAALAGARKKDIGDGLWAFDRHRSQSDVGPLEALALARHGWVAYVAGAHYDVLASVF